ncbi:MAG: TIGR03435 family protein [Terracidiphilus sp.]
MLQSLLIDRFQLKFHRETKDGVVYKLVTGNSTLTLRAPKDKDEYSWAGGIGGGVPRSSGLSGLNISMPQLASRISAWLARPVLDETGLPGSYDFEFQTGIEDDDPNADVASSIITSLKGLGLNLKTGKGPVESIVIDRVEKPSEN